MHEYLIYFFIPIVFYIIAFLFTRSLVNTYGYEGEKNPLMRLFFKHGIGWVAIPFFILNVFAVYVSTWLLSLVIGPLPIITALAFISIVFFMDMINDITNYFMADRYTEADNVVNSITAGYEEENFEEWRRWYFDEKER